MKTKLTLEQESRVMQSIDETVSLINKEKSYSLHLQNKDRIKELELHLNKLQDMLFNGWNAPELKTKTN